MPRSVVPPSVTAFLRDVRARGVDAVFLDCDGTLIEYAPTPDGVRTDGLKLLFNNLRNKMPAAVITGRDMAWVDEVFGPIPASASHGVTIRYDHGGPVEYLTDIPDLFALDNFVVKNRPAVLPEGVWVENKECARALHFRAAGAVAADVVRGWAERAVAAYNAGRDAAAHIDLTAGDMVFEVGPAGVDKGTVVDLFMKHGSFAGKRPVFCGDSAADIPGIRAAQRAGGIGAGVGAKGGTLGVDNTISTPRDMRQALRMLSKEI